MLLTLRLAGCQSVPAVERPSQESRGRQEAKNEKQIQTATKPFLAPSFGVNAKAASRRIDVCSHSISGDSREGARMTDEQERLGLLLVCRLLTRDRAWLILGRQIHS
jgi:hypothetical protein